MIKIIIADDHELIRQGFHVLLRKQEQIQIAGEAQDGKELLQKVRDLEPDIVITDIMMPLMDGIEATRQIKQEYPHIGVIALTMFNEDHLVIDMLEAGAQGYLLKNTNKNELAEAVHAVYHGGTYFCAATTAKLACLIGMSKFNPYRTKPRTQFTEKETLIMQLICQEKLNTDIAKELNMSVRTVEGYRERVFEKTGAKNIAGIAVFAIKHGYYKV
ncbi:MAG: two component transcriptional regulator, LuxR family [Flaviaesturariibacter sp.]|nr:two component transcriptional regulator, LuxR family [Flaviaesturariibacter sp.]